MVDALINSVSNLPPEIATAVLSMIPVTESRAAVPLAMSMMGVGFWDAILYSVIVGAIAASILLVVLGPIVGFLVRHFNWARRFFDWLFTRTHHKLVGKYEKYGLLALMLFVAIPLPGTGVWTGSLAAFIFGVPKKKAFVFIVLGAIIASSILALATAGLIQVFT